MNLDEKHINTLYIISFAANYVQHEPIEQALGTILAARFYTGSILGQLHGRDIGICEKFETASIFQLALLDLGNNFLQVVETAIDLFRKKAPTQVKTLLYGPISAFIDLPDEETKKQILKKLLIDFEITCLGSDITFENFPLQIINVLARHSTQLDKFHQKAGR